MSEVLSLSKAAERLPIRQADGRAWLRAEGLVSRLGGREVVLWADVEEALRKARAGAPPAKPAAGRRAAPERRRGGL